MPSCSRVQSMLQAAVQSLHWTYTIFWQLSPQQRVLRWSDGFYNGEIKVRRIVEAIEANKSSSNNEEASLQRSNQLRDLYDLLLSDRHGDHVFAVDPPTTPLPCTALSPEDLSESGWYYLMCVSFSFAPGVGLSKTSLYTTFIV
ncbi:truncated basic helix-loop-helix protein A-like isoform X2 [Arachis hypogaea]|uniref:truncated basic helix-loop-helix protein A-like isoform X2 n=1 Tax=Arachis hypogaea TaxID=3818 RepID=UPI000DECD8FF|nr:truncated basic helix-loop-helix protein A-like isoform X2 [Arachis hypogaea]